MDGKRLAGDSEMTKLEQLAQWITREDLIDGTDYAGLFRSAQKVVDATRVYVGAFADKPWHPWGCALIYPTHPSNVCTCGATALFTALANFRAAEAKGPT